MDSLGSLIPLFFAVFPIVVYIFMFYSIIPYKFVSLHRSRRYLISGMVSPFLLFIFFFIFPWWNNPVETAWFLKYVIYGFLQVGIIEELNKFLAFQWVTSERINAKYDLPIATVFYSLVTSLGFALTENLSYVVSLYNINSNNDFITPIELRGSMISLAISRSFTAVIMHIVCGIIIGYFVAKNYNNENRKISSTKKLLNVSSGVFFAALYHGIYDINLMVPNNTKKTLITIFVIILGITISYFIIKKLISQSRLIVLEKTNKKK